MEEGPKNPGVGLENGKTLGTDRQFRLTASPSRGAISQYEKIGNVGNIEYGTRNIQCRRSAFHFPSSLDIPCSIFDFFFLSENLNSH
jgi:hypothetical protein